jgi:hypothetical protein
LDKNILDRLIKFVIFFVSCDFATIGETGGATGTTIGETGGTLARLQYLRLGVLT